MKPKMNQAADQYVPQKFDACQTPPYALEPLLPFIRREWLIWEPAYGEGNICKTLFMFNTIGTDLLTGQNFFTYQPPKWDALITNPPYTIKFRWLARCYELGKPFALLLPVETLGAKTAQKLFRQHGVEVIFMDRRINFGMPNIGFEKSSAQFPTAWFTWQFKLPQPMVFAELTRQEKSSAQLSLFEVKNA